MPTVDRRKPRRFERRFRLGGLQKRHKRFDVRLRITGLRDDILDWRLVQRRQSYRELEARGRIGRIDDAQSRLVGRKEIDHAGGAFGDGNGPIALVDRDANLAQQLDRTGTGRVAVGVGDRKPLACDLPGDIGQARVGDRPGTGLGADENRALAVAESSAGVVNLLATDKARLGIVYSTDATAGFKLLVPLPLLDQPPIEYVVAQARDPQSDTQPFMAFVKSAAAQAAFKSAGLAPIDDAQAAGGVGD